MGAEAEEPEIRFASEQRDGVEALDFEHADDFAPATPPATPAPSEGYSEPLAAPDSSGITRPSRRGSSPRFLTDVIVDDGPRHAQAGRRCARELAHAGTTPERVLLDSGALTQDALARALAERYGLDHLDLGVFQVDMSAANLVTTTIAKRYQAVPVAFADKRTLLVAMADPSNVLAVDDIAIMTGYEVRVAVAPPDDIAALVSRLDRLEDVVGASAESFEEARRTAARSSRCTRPPTTRRSSSSSTSSSRRPSSVAPQTSTWRPRARSCASASASTACCRTSRRCRGAWPPGSISRIKIMAELNIAEKRLPQDGRVGPRGRRPPRRPARRDAAERARRGRS